MSQLDWNTTKKEQMDKNNIIKLAVGDNECRKYKIEAICDSAIYKKKLK